MESPKEIKVEKFEITEEVTSIAKEVKLKRLRIEATKVKVEQPPAKEEVEEEKTRPTQLPSDSRFKFMMRKSLPRAHLYKRGPTKY